MPSWLVEDPSPVYLLLGVVGLVLIVGLYMTRKRKFAAGLGVIALLILIVWVLDFLIVTDGEQIILNTKDMAAAVSQRNVERIFSHISDEFRVGASNKEAFRRRVEQHIPEVTELKVWDFTTSEVSRKNRKATLVFMVKGKGPTASGVEFYCCRARFVLDSDNRWRLQTFELFPPQSDPNTAPSIGLPF